MSRLWAVAARTRRPEPRRGFRPRAARWALTRQRTAASTVRLDTEAAEAATAGHADGAAAWAAGVDRARAAAVRRQMRAAATRRAGFDVRGIGPPIGPPARSLHPESTGGAAGGRAARRAVGSARRAGRRAVAPAPARGARAGGPGAGEDRRRRLYAGSGDGPGART